MSGSGWRIARDLTEIAFNLAGLVFAGLILFGVLVSLVLALFS